MTFTIKGLDNQSVFNGVEPSNLLNAFQAVLHLPSFTTLTSRLVPKTRCELVFDIVVSELTIITIGQTETFIVS